MRASLRAALLAALALVTAVAMVPAHAESSPSAYGSRLVSLINQARQQHGLPALAVTSGTSTVATGWTQHLAAQGALSHNPDLGPQLEAHGSPNWTTYGENVGEGPSSSADAVFNAYMNSPEHRDNILGSRYRYLGIGVVYSGSTAWNTLDFVDQYSSTTGTAAARTAPAQSSSPRVTRHVPAAPRPVTHAPTHAVRQPSQPARVAAAHATLPARPAPRPHRHAVPAARAAAAPATALAATTPVQSLAAAAAAMPLPIHAPAPRRTAPLAVAGVLLALLALSFGRVVSTR